MNGRRKTRERCVLEIVADRREGLVNAAAAASDDDNSNKNNNNNNNSNNNDDTIGPRTVAERREKRNRKSVRESVSEPIGLQPACTEIKRPSCFSQSDVL